eukprot:10736263-Ditylum_brightwellii.AAC.1
MVSGEGKKAPQHHLCLSEALTIKEDIDTQNSKLDHTQMHIHTLKQHLVRATEKVNELSKECNDIKHLSNQLKEKIRVLLAKRNHQ